MIGKKYFLSGVLKKILSVALSLFIMFTNFGVNSVNAEESYNEEGVSLTSNTYYTADFVANFENSQVAWYAWKAGDDLSNITESDLHIIENNGDTVHVDEYNTASKTGYLVFFVKPNDNYMFTGLGASGNGDYYIVGSGEYGNITGWLNSDLVNVAKEAGYIGVFGYSAQGASKSGDFKIVAQSPDMIIKAEPNKANDIVEGEEITFTVTITPVKTESKKDVVSGVTINSATINDNAIDVQKNITKPVDQNDGTYVSTFTYVATKEDCENETIELKVNGTVTYKCSASMSTGGTSITTATITKDATTTCNIAKKAQVTYKFESATSNKELPLEVYNLRPEDTNEYVVGTSVDAITFSTTRVDVDNENEHGYWTFKGYDKSSKTMSEDGITFIGTWKWTEKKGTVGYYLALSNATWDIPEGVSETIDNNLTKYFYDKKFTTGDKFTVTSNVPSDDGYAFIGWLDKERDKKEAKICNAGTELVYLYDNKNPKTYTLDALWANISVASTTATYDGNTHTIGDVSLAINQGTNLKEEYVKQAKALITEDKTSIRYSKDGKNWEVDKPTFKDAGTYTIYVKESITLDGKTVEIMGEGTVTINKRNVTLTSESASKTYDGSALEKPTVTVTSDGFVESEVSDIKANGSIVEVGKVTNSISYNKNENFKDTNYSITKQEGSLEITAQSINPDDDKYDGILVGTLKNVIYNGLNQEQEPSVTNKENVALTKDVDYTISFSEDTKNVGTVIVTITGINNYTGTVTRTYQITKAPLYISTASVSREYTGEELTAGIKEINGLKNDETLSISTNGSITNFGKVDNTYTIDWDSSSAKQSNYTITDKLGSLEVTKKSVTITSGSASRVYNKEPLTNSEVTAVGFVDGEGATYDVTGSQLNIGSSDNVFTYTLNDNTKAENYDIKVEYGKLEVTNAEDVVVTIKGNTDETIYDGQSHEVSNYTYSITEGSTYSVNDFKFNGKTVTVSGKDVGNYSLNLKADQFENLNSNYKVTFVIENDTTLNIKPRELTLTSGSSDKVYDGTALTNDAVTVTGDGFADGEGATYSVTGSQLNVGSSVNKFAYTLNEGTKANNYKITTETGTLEVEPITDEVVVTIKGNSDNVKYDGKTHSVSGYKVTNISNNLYEEKNFKYNGLTSISGKNADTYYIELDEPKFENTNNNFTNVKFVVENGTLTITKRVVKLTSASDSKVYDGTALTNNNVTVSEDDFVTGEGATYDVTGSQTNYGSSKNAFTYSLNSNTLGSNYEISKEEGDLSITKVGEVIVTIKGHTSSEKYDGKEKTVKGYDVSITSGSLYKESDFTFTGSSTINKTDAGTYYMGLSEDDFVNNNINFDKVTFIVEDGSLTISKRDVILSSTSDSKTYDGKPLTSSEVTIIGDGFVEGEAIAYANGSITDKGSVTNEIVIKKSDSYDDNNYNVVIKEEGTLTIDEAPLTIITYSNKKTYDGKPLFAGGKIDGLIDGETASLDVKSSRTDVGETKNDSYVINWESAKESNYKIVNEGFGTLTVTRKTIVITTDSASKEYDGKALVAGGSVSGLENDETVTFNTIGSQTNEGSSTNNYSLVWDGTAKETNYKVEEKLGTLTVTSKSNPAPDKKDDITPTPTPTPTVTPVPVRPTPNPSVTPTPTPSSEPSEEKKDSGSVVIPTDNSDDDSNDTIDSVTIDDEDTPEWATRSKHWALINLICAVASLLLGIFLVLSKKEKDDDEDEREENIELNNEDEDTKQVRHARWKVVAIIDALLSIILFILTENMTLPMILIDRWTLLMVALTLINVVAVIFGRKFHKPEEEEEAK